MGTDDITEVKRLMGTLLHNGPFKGIKMLGSLDIRIRPDIDSP